MIRSKAREGEKERKLATEHKHYSLFRVGKLEFGNQVSEKVVLFSSPPLRLTLHVTQWHRIAKATSCWCQWRACAVRQTEMALLFLLHASVVSQLEVARLDGAHLERKLHPSCSRRASESGPGEIVFSAAGA